MIVLAENHLTTEQWDTFVEQHPESRFCHLYNYGQVNQVYGFEPRYFCFLKGSDIIALFPVVYVRSALFGRKLVSQPFSEYGGPLLAASVTQDDTVEIVQLLRQYIADNQIPCIEMHGCNGMPLQYCEDYMSLENPHHHAYLSLDQPIDTLWSKVVRYAVRKAVNKAMRSQISVEECCDEETIIKRFFPLYVQSMKRMGVPPHSVDYYIECYRAFGDRMKIFWAIRHGKTIAGLLGFASGQRVNIVNTVSDAVAWEHRPNDLLHWEYIKWAHGQGYGYFDFGSVRYEGQFRYKEKWGCTITKHGHYFIPAGDTVGKSTFDSSSRTMQMFAKTWSRYVPCSVSIVVGPMIRKQLVR